MSGSGRFAWAVASLLAFGAARGAGWAAASSLSPGAERVLVPGVLSLTLRDNRGVAFGLLAQLPVAATIALALTVLAVVLYNRSAWLATPPGQWGFGLMLGGALGNVADRLRFGYVVDYLDVHVWPVFNLADTAIVIGAGLLVLSLRAGDSATGRARRPPG